MDYARVARDLWNHLSEGENCPCLLELVERLTSVLEEKEDGPDPFAKKVTQLIRLFIHGLLSSPNGRNFVLGILENLAIFNPVLLTYLGYELPNISFPEWIHDLDDSAFPSFLKEGAPWLAIWVKMFNTYSDDERRRRSLKQRVEGDDDHKHDDESDGGETSLSWIVKLYDNLIEGVGKMVGYQLEITDANAERLVKAVFLNLVEGPSPAEKKQLKAVKFGKEGGCQCGWIGGPIALKKLVPAVNNLVALWMHDISEYNITNYKDREEEYSFDFLDQPIKKTEAWIDESDAFLFKQDSLGKKDDFNEYFTWKDLKDSIDRVEQSTERLKGEYEEKKELYKTLKKQLKKYAKDKEEEDIKNFFPDILLNKIFEVLKDYWHKKGRSPPFECVTLNNKCWVMNPNLVDFKDVVRNEDIFTHEDEDDECIRKKRTMGFGHMCIRNRVGIVTRAIEELEKELPLLKKKIRVSEKTLKELKRDQEKLEKTFMRQNYCKLCNDEDYMANKNSEVMLTEEEEGNPRFKYEEITKYYEEELHPDYDCKTCKEIEKEALRYGLSYEQASEKIQKKREKEREESPPEPSLLQKGAQYGWEGMKMAKQAVEAPVKWIAGT